MSLMNESSLFLRTIEFVHKLWMAVKDIDYILR